MASNLFMTKTIRLVSLQLSLLWAISFALHAGAQTLPLAEYKLAPAPEPTGLLLKRGDRLAICGDSITEQKMYSRIIEDYLTMCVPELEISVRQYGWSGERAPGFRARMTNDCLRFFPTVATTCYGMNDHEYRPYEDRIGRAYREHSTAIIRAFKAHGAVVIHGSPGCVGKMPSWVKSATGTVDDLNRNLAMLRNIGIEIARDERVRFADVFAPMINAGLQARQLYGTNFAIAGKDGVHPGWAGQAVMAYAFLKAMGLSGDLGTFTVDLKKNRMTASSGHKVLSAQPARYEVASSRFPFVACAPEQEAKANYPVCAPDDVTRDNTIRSALSLIPFNSELNRFMLIARNPNADFYRVTWRSPENEGASRVFSAAQLTRGINLAEEFPANPFSSAFAEVDAAVAAKQAFETRQVKQIFHGAEGKADMDAAVRKTEAERAPLVRAIQQAFQPVRHVLLIEPARAR